MFSHIVHEPRAMIGNIWTVHARRGGAASASAVVSRFLSTSSTPQSFYQDSALAWGRENPQVAQACLNLPSMDPEEMISHPSLLLKDWRGYWKWRKWDFPQVQSAKDLSHAQALTTHVLSAPLTIASCLFRSLSLPDRRIDSDDKESAIRLCCIGARAESMLPVEYWRELFLVGSVMRPTIVKRRIILSFVGPEIIKRPPATFTFGEGYSLELQWLYKGLFHDYISFKDPLENQHFDAFVFLNPGFGHPHLSEGWKPTLEALLRDRDERTKSNAKNLEPLFLATAHSRLDADRDAAYLLNNFEESFQDASSSLNGSGGSSGYIENPFASRIVYQDEDPAKPQHFVQPNHYYRLLALGRP